MPIDERGIGLRLRSRPTKSPPRSWRTLQFERAAQLSSSPDDRARRLVEAAEAAHLGGQRNRALSLLAAADIRGDVRLEVQGARVRGVVEAQSGSPARAMRILLDAATAIHPLGRAAALGAATDEPRLLVSAASASMFLGEDQRVFELLTRAVSAARARGEI